MAHLYLPVPLGRSRGCKNFEGDAPQQVVFQAERRLPTRRRVCIRFRNVANISSSRRDKSIMFADLGMYDITKHYDIQIKFLYLFNLFF
jgi:hypothetical protein